ncbi:MAG: hypothetical protein ACI4QV_04320 [Acutalibacteraceae bacterium]
MKRIIPLILSASMALMTIFCASADSVSAEVGEPYKASFVFPDGYTPVTKETVDENSELISFLGLTNEQMNSYFDDSGFLVFSISSDYREQIYVIAEQNDISSAIVNLSDIEDPSSVQSLLIGDIEYDGAEVSVTEPIDGDVYFYVVKQTADGASSDGESSGDAALNAAEDGKTEPAMIYYVTVKDSVAYVICYSSESGRISSDAKLMMSGFVNSLTIGDGSVTVPQEEQNLVQIIVNWVLIAAAAGVVIYGVVSIVSEFRRRKLEEDFHNKTPHKPIR